MRDYLKIKQLLGLCMRAGRLTSGENIVLDNIRNHKAKLIIVTSDLSERTLKQITDKSNYYKVPICKVDFDSYEMIDAIGKPRKIIAIMDNGFAKKLNELIIEKGD